MASELVGLLSACVVTVPVLLVELPAHAANMSGIIPKAAIADRKIIRILVPIMSAPRCDRRRFTGCRTILELTAKSFRGLLCRQPRYLLDQIHQIDPTDRRLCVAVFQQVCFAGTNWNTAQVLVQLSPYCYARLANEWADQSPRGRRV
jgi:hypothetical protein